MVILHRKVRFAVSDPAASPPAPPSASAPDAAKSDNGYAGVPAMRGVGRHYEVTVACRGEVDTTTGYFMDIKTIDRAVRTSVIPLIEKACHVGGGEPGSVLAGAVPALSEAIGRTGARAQLSSVRWELSPYYAIEMRAADPTTVLLRQKFEFAASHRLHAPALSEEENRRLFGKCNYPNGHGHNYIVEPCVAVKLGAGRSQPFLLTDLEPVVNSCVIERLDHKHLNLDLPEFDTGRPEGVNPSVENIAALCYRWLLEPIRQASKGAAELTSVTVWETEKTSATFPG